MSRLYNKLARNGFIHRSPFGEPRATEDRLLGEKSHDKVSRSKSNDPCLPLAVSSKFKSECDLCTTCQSVQRTKSWNDTETINDVSFENVINYYKVSKTSDKYVCAKFTSDQFIKKLDEKLREESDKLFEFTHSVSVASNLDEEEIDSQLRVKHEELERLVKQDTCSSLDANPLRLGSAELESFDGPSTRIYRFPSTGIGLDRSEGSVFNMTVCGPRSAASLLARHWGPQREVTVRRDMNNSLGISIVGGKVRKRRNSKMFFCFCFVMSSCFVLRLIFTTVLIQIINRPYRVYSLKTYFLKAPPVKTDN